MAVNPTNPMGVTAAEFQGKRIHENEAPTHSQVTSHRLRELAHCARITARNE